MTTPLRAAAEPSSALSCLRASSISRTPQGRPRPAVVRASTNRRKTCSSRRLCPVKPMCASPAWRSSTEEQPAAQHEVLAVRRVVEAAQQPLERVQRPLRRRERAAPPEAPRAREQEVDADRAEHEGEEHLEADGGRLLVKGTCEGCVNEG